MWAIHVMDADGSNQVQLGDGGSPAWSPDGSQIAFAFGGGIWVMNADGSDRRELVNTASPGLPDSTVRIGRPTWSPDGQRIAFQACRCTLPVPFGYRQVMIMDADGTNVRPLSQDGWTTFSPAWSPVDADRIAVKSYDRMPSDSASFDHVIAFYSVSTGQREIRYRPHVRRLDYTHEAFDWSPGGRYIAFTQYNGYGGISRILYMDVETGDVRPLIPDDVDAFTPPDAEQYGVAWSRN
ncbi:MAG: hypothetical protein GWM93_00850 [Gemmatimonadetes bacterium]|nr:hypothetical protein [Gemmatimonadota bacterium]NIY33807.1 hypothetical protein [Gemmatimonadota bacterium]